MRENSLNMRKWAKKGVFLLLAQLSLSFWLKEITNETMRTSASELENDGGVIIDAMTLCMKNNNRSNSLTNSKYKYHNSTATIQTIHF